MSDTQDITPADGENFPNREGKHPVEVTCPGCDETVTIHVPDGHTDREVTFEHRHDDGSVTKGSWVNPDAPVPVNPETDDVMWDGAQGAYVARVGEAGGSSDTASA